MSELGGALGNLRERRSCPAGHPELDLCLVADRRAGARHGNSAAPLLAVRELAREQLGQGLQPWRNHGSGDGNIRVSQTSCVLGWLKLMHGMGGSRCQARPELCYCCDCLMSAESVGRWGYRLERTVAMPLCQLPQLDQEQLQHVRKSPSR